MNNTLYVSIVGVVFFLVIIFIVIIALKPQKNVVVTTKKQGKTKKRRKEIQGVSPIVGLDDLFELARNARSKEELNRCVLGFLKTEVLPDRRGKNMSDDARRKLSFISTVCGNPCADAKLISFFIMELENRYPAYRAELEMYQNMGIAKRRMTR